MLKDLYIYRVTWVCSIITSISSISIVRLDLLPTPILLGVASDNRGMLAVPYIASPLSDGYVIAFFTMLR